MPSVQETQGPTGYKGSSCSSRHQEVTPFGCHSRPNSLLGLLIALNFIFSHQRKLRNFHDPMTFRRAQGAEAGQVVYSLCRANAPGCGWCRTVAPTTHTSRSTPARTMCAPPGTLGPRATALPGPRAQRPTCPLADSTGHMDKVPRLSDGSLGHSSRGAFLPGSPFLRMLTSVTGTVTRERSRPHSSLPCGPSHPGKGKATPHIDMMAPHFEVCFFSEFNIQ